MAERVVELTDLGGRELGARIAELAEVARARLGMEKEGPALGGKLVSGSVADGINSGPIEVEVGPLNDFAQLTGFEDAAAGINGASDIRRPAGLTGRGRPRSR